MMNSDELRLAFDAKVRKGIFAPVGRHLPDDVREDRLQDGICMTWAMFERYAERGEVLNDAILVHACRLRATDASRYYVPADGQRKKDVFDPRSYMSGKVEVLRLDGIDDTNGSDATSSLGYADVYADDPTTKLMSALDLSAWLVELPEEDQELLALRASGYTLEETGLRMGMSTSFAFGRSRRLGEELAERAGVSIVQTKNSADAPVSTRRSRSSGQAAVKRRAA